MASPRFLSASQGIASVAVPAAIAMLLGAWLDGETLWIVAALLAVAVALGSLAGLAGIDPRGVPVETTFLPAVAALGGLGVAHLGGVAPLALAGMGLGGSFVALSIAAERALARDGVIGEEAGSGSSWSEIATRADHEAVSGPEAASGPEVASGPDAASGPEPDADPGGSPAAATVDRVRSPAEWRVLAVAVPVTFLGMVGVIGLAGREFVAGLPASASPSLAGSAELAVVMVGAAFVASLVGFRIAATDTADVGEVLWMAAGYGLLAAAAVIGLRVGGVPVLSWPGILTAVVYLWGVYHRLLDPVDTTARRLVDLLIVGGACLVAAAAQLRGG